MAQLLRDRYIDPATGDYVVSDGQPVTTASISPSVYRAITTRRGSFIADPELGSDLGDRDLQLASDDTPLLIEAATKLALGRLQVAAAIAVDQVSASLSRQRAELTVTIQERGQPATITTSI